MPVLPAILPLLILQNGYSYLEAGILVTAFNLVSSFAQPAFGIISDRRGLAVPLGAVLFTSAFFVCLMGIANSYIILFTCSALSALGHACFHPAALSMVSRLCTDENRGQVTSYFVVGGNIGYAVGPVLAGAAVTLYGLPGLLLLLIPAVIAALTINWIVPQSLFTPARDTSPDGRKDASPVNYRPFSILMGATILRSWAVFVIITYLPVYLVSRGYDLVAAASLLTMSLLIGVAGQIAGGHISDRYGRREYMLAGLLLGIPPFLFFMLTTGTVSLIALFLFSFILWSTFSVAVAMGHELLPGMIGLASGMMLGLAIGFGGLGVAVNGMIADTFSLDLALGIIPVPLIGAALLILVLPYPWKTFRNRAK
ncbi:MAG: Major Facilitator Superfamily protein [Methanoregula sp. PtaU1.Bin051]|nr:MAG: Major Facilitator Superfamily protein [Methanoregula sp. PtaU1.Bin051]